MQTTGVYTRMLRFLARRFVNRWPERCAEILAARRDLLGDALERFLADEAGGGRKPLEPSRPLDALCAGLTGRPLSLALVRRMTQALGVQGCFSQEGEDLFLVRLLGETPRGFYVDVGAHHPVRFSNTHMLHLLGRRGINIDAARGSMTPFAQFRPQDVNLEIAVSDKPGPLTLHTFAEGALNTGDPALAQTYRDQGWTYLGPVETPVRRLDDILAEHAPPGLPFELLSIDVEGEELGVLASNDWGKYSPEWIVIEALDVPLRELKRAPAVAYAVAKGYEPLAKFVNTVILRREG